MLTKGAAAVWAMEPNEANATCLAESREEIQEGKVCLLEVAAWGAAGRLGCTGKTLRFHSADAPPPGEGESAEPAELVVEVPTIAIDGLIARERILQARPTYNILASKNREEALFFDPAARRWRRSLPRPFLLADRLC